MAHLQNDKDSHLWLKNHMNFAFYLLNVNDKKSMHSCCIELVAQYSIYLEGVKSMVQKLVPVGQSLLILICLGQEN